MVRGGGKSEESWKTSSAIMTRSMTSRIAAASKTSKIHRKKKESVMKKKKKKKLYDIPGKYRQKREEPVIEEKLYEVPGSNGARYTSLTPEEYIAAENALEEYLTTHHLRMGPGHKQRQNDLECRQYFSMIQANRKEMADYELVEPMAVTTIVDFGFWAHMNFKAKPKDADDSSTAVYFAELHLPVRKVTCLAKLDIDLTAGDNSSYMRCGICGMDPEELVKYPIAGCGPVYHPLDAGSWIIGGRARYKDS